MSRAGDLSVIQGILVPSFIGGSVLGAFAFVLAATRVDEFAALDDGALVFLVGFFLLALGVAALTPKPANTGAPSPAVESSVRGDGQN